MLDQGGYRSNDWHPSEKGQQRHRHTPKEEGRVKPGAGLGVLLAKAKECLSHQKLGERHGVESPQSPQEGPALLTPCSGLGTVERASSRKAQGH